MLLGKFVPDCGRSNLRGSKFKIFPEGDGDMPPDPPSSHTCYYHPATILFPPQLKSLYETLRMNCLWTTSPWKITVLNVVQSHPLHVYNNKVMIEELLSTYNKACRVSNEASQLVVSCRCTSLATFGNWTWKPIVWSPCIIWHWITVYMWLFYQQNRC